MGYGYYPYFQPTGINPIMYDGSGQQLAKFSHSAAVSLIEGAEATNDDLRLKANTNDDYPYINLAGDGWISLYGKGGIALYEQATNFMSFYQNVANDYYIRGGLVSGDDLTLQANSIDTYSAIQLDSSANKVICKGYTIAGQSAGTDWGTLSISGSDFVLTANRSNGNITLIPNGTGLVKFGTHTGTGDVACNGHITMLDSGGTSRKLMTTA